MCKVYSKKITDAYKCCRCGAMGVRLYRLKFTHPLYCAHCSETVNVKKPFIKPTPERCNDFWVTAIPCSWDKEQNRISCYGYLHPAQDAVEWWKRLKDVGTATLGTITRVWI